MRVGVVNKPRGCHAPVLYGRPGGAAAGDAVHGGGEAGDEAERMSATRV